MIRPASLSKRDVYLSILTAFKKASTVLQWKVSKNSKKTDLVIVLNRRDGAKAQINIVGLTFTTARQWARACVSNGT